jgi:antirestriction protein ArdC
MKQDIYERVTYQIIADLEEGVRPWIKPWSGEHAAGRITRPLRSNGIPYRGINILMLWAAAMAGGYSAPLWLTYKQAAELGGQVRKGEKGSLVVFANTITRTEQDEATGEDVEHSIPYMKGYTVFNAEQVDGLPAHFYAQAEQPKREPLERILSVDSYLEATKVEIRYGGNRAYYTMAEDRVQVPPVEAFRDIESFYATIVHEVVHWTRHPSRLEREFGRKQWGDEGYAREELVAEIGAAFLCADLGITPEVREDHASYVAGWLEVLKNDKRAIFSAAAHAQRAVDFLDSLQPQATESADMEAAA